MDEESSRGHRPTETLVRRVPGALLGGRYRLSRRLATGGMGEVWVATDDVLGREVAVKILRDDLVDSTQFLDRFRAEARHTALLSHPGIASVFDYGEEAERDGVAYLVMELVDGEPLSNVIARRPQMDIAAAVATLIQVADALHAAHERGVIHRDVKPGNVMVTCNGTIKVTDFGISRAADSVPITAAGQVLGTAQYMSPEQALGADVTPASDVYSLGVIAYELIAGHRPFIVDNPAALALAHVQQTPPPLPDSVPADVRSVVDRSLAKDPARRPASALEFADDLRGANLDSSTAMTTVMAASTSGATEVMPAAFVAENDTRPTAAAELHQDRHRRRLALTAFALLALAGIAAIGAAVGGDAPLTPSTIEEVSTSVPHEPASSATLVADNGAPVPTVAAVDTGVVDAGDDSKGRGKGKGRGG